MRVIFYLIIAVIAFCLVTIGFANNQMVVLTLFPSELAVFIGFNQSQEMPLYQVVLIGVALGLLLGYAFEWLRESKHRSAATRGRRNQAQLEAEIQRLKAEKNKGKDEILVILEEGAAAR